MSADSSSSPVPVADQQEQSEPISEINAGKETEAETGVVPLVCLRAAPWQCLQALADTAHHDFTSYL